MLLTLEGARVVATDAGFDVASVTAWERLLDEITTAHNRLDVMVAIASETYATPTPIAETTLAQFRGVITPNLEGAFLAVRYGIPKMRAFGHGGAVVLVGARGRPNQAAVSASASGLKLMTKSAALACAEAKDNIRVNAVLVEDAEAAEAAAQAVAHLASAAAAYITGFAMPVGAR